ncbi:MAG: aconitase X catalytic domain-containing protein [bacterium]|nr:aconitase X catalytic domain-containing protein [bacterium]MDE0290410.1 aconitase X catalytic domain-containing protein [bacterium]MDE0437826.1 aconitase X catalytic domain-containing protein [bacterium]
MRLTYEDLEMLDGKQGEARRRAMEGLVQLGEAFGAEDLVSIGYAHVHPGMAMYAQDVELLEELVDLGAHVAVPTTANVTNVDTENWKQTGAPESLARLHMRGVRAHKALGCVSAMTCTPYWAGHWPTWNMHMTSIESGVTVFCNSVLGARSNRDGFFSVYAALTGRYPRFGYHLDENRAGTHLVTVETRLDNTTDFSCLGYHLGPLVGTGVPVFTGFSRRPSLDELDALGAGLATTGGVSMFIVPGITPPYSSTEQAFGRRRPPAEIRVGNSDIDRVYESFSSSPPGSRVDFVHIGCPHASFQEMKEYAALLSDRTVHPDVEMWITTSGAVKALSAREGLIKTLAGAGATVITDTCPMSCHFARTTSPDPGILLPEPRIRRMVVDSAKQAKYSRDMIMCETLLTTTTSAVATAISGRLVTGRAHP